MTPTLAALLVTWGAGLALIGSRRTFQVAMIDAELAKVRLVAYDIERLACEGRIDRTSAFYRYFRGSALKVSAIKAEDFPSFAVIALGIVAHEARPKPDAALHRDAWHEVGGRYKDHADIPRRLMQAMAAVLQYRSLLVWVFIKAGVAVVLTMDQLSAMAKVFAAIVNVFDSVLSRPQRLLHA